MVINFSGELGVWLQFLKVIDMCLLKLPYTKTKNQHQFIYSAVKVPLNCMFVKHLPVPANRVITLRFVTNQPLPYFQSPLTFNFGERINTVRHWTIASLIDTRL